MTVLVIPAELERRRARSAKRAAELMRQMDAWGLTESEHPDMALFATGSLGRQELGSHSDLDVFLVDTAEPTHRHGNLNGIKLRAKLIDVAQTAGFEEFSGDGKFLVIHNLADLVVLLGTRDDDSRNVFTARMLLLLESVPLMGRAAYDTCVETAIGVYSRDADDPEAFLPHFLVNDIVRYWKTLCLSYEAKRHDLHELRDRGETAEAEKQARAGRVDLLKLRFNRLWMCFNGLAFLLSGVEGECLSATHVGRMIELSPLERALELAEIEPGTAGALQEILDLFAEFLELTDAKKEIVISRLEDKSAFEHAHEQGKRFGDLMDEVVTSLADRAGVRRFLLI